MKKNVLALSIATMVGGLGFAGAASAALSVAESGAGHILMVPYYTAQNGNMTVFHITNTDEVNGKAVKVRFRGASNSDDVLDFQVFLSPGDVWTAAITKDSASGVAKLTTADNSCTFPAIPKAGINFVTERLASPLWNTAEKKNAQTLEGYVEILTMADIPKPASTAWTSTTAADPRLYTAIKHVNGVAPCTPAVLAQTMAVAASPAATSSTPAVVADMGSLQLAGTKALSPADFDLVAPGVTPALTGQWYVMNVEQTTTFSAAMPAIASDVRPYNVFSPQKNTGDVKTLTAAGATPTTPATESTVANSLLESADPLLLSKLIPPQFYDVPDLSTPYSAGYATAADQATELTKAIARSSIINQFASDAGINAKTDWVFSLPTRRYAIAANYAAVNTSDAATTAGISVWDAAASTPALSPVVQTTAAASQQVKSGTAGYRVVNPDVLAGTNLNTFTAVAPVNGTSVAGGLTSVNDEGQICITAGGIKFWDREEVTSVAAADQPVFSPSQPAKQNAFDLCGEIGVLSFSADESALGAALSRKNVDAKYSNGWGLITAPTDKTTPTAVQTYIPVLGAAFVKLSNPQARDGVSGTYGLTWTHAYGK